MQSRSNHQKVLLFAQILSRIVLLFVLAELLLLPFRQAIISAYVDFLTRVGVINANISWECTAIDETLLVLIAILLWRRCICTIVGALLSALAVQVFNVLRIVVLSAYPDPLLHELLFRIGGYFVVIVAVSITLLACEKLYKKGNSIRGEGHGRRGRI